MCDQGVNDLLTCGFWTSSLILTVCYQTSAYLRVAFTVEAYCSIVHAVRHKSLFTVCRAKVISVLILFITLSYEVSRVYQSLDTLVYNPSVAKLNI